MPTRYRPTEAPDLPVEQLTPFVNEVRQDLMYYFSQIWAGWPIKGAVGAGVCCVTSLYTNFFYGNITLVFLWMILVTADLILGVMVALRKSKFTMARLKKFVTKVFAHALTIALFGVLNHSLTATSGYATPLLDWVMVLLLLTEGASILINMDKMGWPVPKIAHKIIAKMDKSANQKIDALLEVDNDNQN